MSTEKREIACGIITRVVLANPGIRRSKCVLDSTLNNELTGTDAVKIEEFISELVKTGHLVELKASWSRESEDKTPNQFNEVMLFPKGTTLVSESISSTPHPSVGKTRRDYKIDFNVPYVIMDHSTPPTEPGFYAVHKFRYMLECALKDTFSPSFLYWDMIGWSIDGIRLNRPEYFWLKEIKPHQQGEQNESK